MWHPPYSKSAHSLFPPQKKPKIFTIKNQGLVKMWILAAEIIYLKKERSIFALFGVFENILSAEE